MKKDKDFHEIIGEQQKRAKRQQEFQMVKSRLEIEHRNLEQLETFRVSAIEKYKEHGFTPRRLQKIQEVLPKIRAVIRQETSAMIKNGNAR